VVGNASLGVDNPDPNLILFNRVIPGQKLPFGSKRNEADYQGRGQGTPQAGTPAVSWAINWVSRVPTVRPLEHRKPVSYHTIVENRNKLQVARRTLPPRRNTLLIDTFQKSCSRPWQPGHLRVLASKDCFLQKFLGFWGRQ
jgi:hypothetical protein